MTYSVLSGTLNPTRHYRTCFGPSWGLSNPCWSCRPTTFRNTPMIVRRSAFLSKTQSLHATDQSYAWFPSVRKDSATQRNAPQAFSVRQKRLKNRQRESLRQTTRTVLYSSAAVNNSYVSRSASLVCWFFVRSMQ